MVIHDIVKRNVKLSSVKFRFSKLNLNRYQNFLREITLTIKVANNTIWNTIWIKDSTANPIAIAIALSLKIQLKIKESFLSAMSMLNFYIN